jgi:phenylacetate-CoA ligase
MTTKMAAAAPFDRALREMYHALRHTAFFPAHLAAAGLRASDIRTERDFARIPYVEKAHFREGFPAGVVAAGITLDDARLHRTQSAGTGGERLSTVEFSQVYSRRLLTSASVHPALSAALTASPKRHVRLAAPNCSSAHCAAPEIGAFSDRLLPDGTLVLAVARDLLTTTAPTWVQSIEEIERFGPTLYYVDPNHMSELAAWVRRYSAPLPRAPVVCTYSLDTALARRDIATAFSDPAPLVAGVFSMSELGWVSVQCPAGRHHVNDESFYAEFVRDGAQARPGELAELIVTTLDKGCTPRIRYRTRDLFTCADGPCRCGHPFRSVTVEGRLADCVVVGGRVALTPRAANETIGAPEWLLRYQLDQQESDRLVLRTIVRDGTTLADLSRVVEALRERIGGGVTIVAERAPYIASTVSGKFATCVSSVARRRAEAGWRL